MMEAVSFRETAKGEERETEISAAIEEAIERYKDMVYRIVLSRTGSEADAEDAFQEVFLTYHRKQPYFTSEEHRKAWLIRVALNCAKKVKYGTWNRRRSEYEEQQEKCGEDFTFALERHDMIFSALRKLPDKYQKVLILFYFEDMSTEQIALALKLRNGTVRMQLCRGRDMLKEILKGEDV